MPSVAGAEKEDEPEARMVKSEGQGVKEENLRAAKEASVAEMSVAERQEE